MHGCNRHTRHRGIMKNLRSEAAIRAVVKFHQNSDYRVIVDAFEFPLLKVHFAAKDSPTATIDIRDFYRKRKPLTGIKSQVAAIVRGKGKSK